MKEEIDKIFGNVNTEPMDTSIFDKDTYEGLEAKRIKKQREHETDPLIESLSESMHVNEDTKRLLMHLAELYLNDMKSNISKDQFELAEKYPETTADDWTLFLNDRVVNTYITKHKNTLLRSKAERNLADPYAKNKRDNITLLKQLSDNEDANKQNIIILRIPYKYEED